MDSGPLSIRSAFVARPPRRTLLELDDKILGGYRAPTTFSSEHRAYSSIIDATLTVFPSTVEAN